MTNDLIFMFRGTHLSNPNKGKWYKFNDTVIEEFDMNDASLEAECFGGAYKAKVYDHCKLFYPHSHCCKPLVTKK